VAQRVEHGDKGVVLSAALAAEVASSDQGT